MLRRRVRQGCACTLGRLVRLRGGRCGVSLRVWRKRSGRESFGRRVVGAAMGRVCCRSMWGKLRMLALMIHGSTEVGIGSGTSPVSVTVVPRFGTAKGGLVSWRFAMS